MSRVILVAAGSVMLAVVSLSSLPALAGGGSAVSATQLLRRAGQVSALEQSAHFAGAVTLVDSATSQGLSFSVKAGAAFSGDVSGRGRPQLKIKGGYHFVSQSRSFVLRLAGHTAAAKLGHAAWRCQAITTTSVPTAAPLGEVRLLLHLRHYLQSLARHATVTEVSTSLHGTPAWDIMIRLRSRLALGAFIHLARSGLSGASHAGLRRGLSILAKLPHPWVYGRIDVWISQLSYTIPRITASFKLHEQQTTLSLKALLNISRYGEAVHIHVPAACSASEPPG